MNIIEQFRSIYFSKKNSDYIRDYVFNKYNVQNLSADYSLESILENIFQSYEHTITNEFIQKKGKIDHENILVQLNKMAMLKLESILQQEKSNNFYTREEKKQTIQQVESTQEQNNVQEVTDIVVGQEKDIQEIEIVQDTKIDVIQNEIVKEYTKIAVTDQNDSGFHFFSEDADYITEDGVFVFKKKISNIKKITLNSFRAKGDLYNIQINNNFFTLIENGESKKITIPIGYYNVKNLIEQINGVFNDIKSNCKLTQSEIKNRICIENTSSKYKTFDIIFPEIDMITIGEMLGYIQKEYRNNNLYIAENLPDVELFDNIYLRIFVNDNEVERINTTKQHFSYFTLVSSKNVENFGTVFNLEKECKYTISQTDIRTISFQLLCNPYIPLSNDIYFEIVLYFN